MKLFLTAYSQNGDVFSKPRVVAVDSKDIETVPPTKSTNFKTQVKEYHENGALKNTFVVYESVAEIKAQQLVDEGQGTTIYAKNHVDLSLDAAGANAAAATDVTKYLSEFDTATAATTDGVQLDAATEGKVRVVINTSGVALEMWPQTGENFDGSAADAALAQAIGTRKHYVCLADGEWTVADDYTQ